MLQLKITEMQIACSEYCLYLCGELGKLSRCCWVIFQVGSSQRKLYEKIFAIFIQEYFIISEF